MSKDFEKLCFWFLGSFSVKNWFYCTKLRWVVVSIMGNKIKKLKKISQGDVRIFHFQMWKTFLKTPKNSIFISQDPHHRISSKFVHPSFIPQVRTYYIFEKIEAVNLVEMSPNQKNGCFLCFFHFLSNKKSLTA